MKKRLNEIINGWLGSSMDRRRFIKITGGVAAASTAAVVLLKSAPANAAAYGQNDPDPTDDDADVVFIHSVCQMCHSRCGIKCKVKGGQLLKIDGNAWHPNNRGEDERLTFATDPATVKAERGRLCPKGQAGIQTLYDPYRIQHPLKRVGARGAGRWEVVTWDDALKDIAKKLNTLIPFATRATANIDDANADLGKIANQLLYSPGRTVEGNLTDRIFKSGYGTQNAKLDHTSICETSHHIGNELMTLDHVNAVQGPNHFKTDVIKSDYMLVFGANPVEANFPMLALARGVADMLDATRSGGAGKLVVVDPRFSNSAAKADQWVPIKPGGDAALALGMARHMIANTLYNAAYLKNANKAAATAGSEQTYTDATWLVITEPGHTNEGKFLTAFEAGIAAPLDAANPVCMVSSTATEAAVKGTSPAAVVGDLDPGEVTVNGLKCRSAFGIYKNSVNGMSLHQYAALCGVDEATITQLAIDFTSHGRKASAWSYRGAVQHTNGTYAQLAIMALNWMIGNVDYAGGLAKGGGSWDEKKATGGVDTTAVTGAPTVAGVRIDRAKADYKTGKTYFKGFPAPRMWFPLAGNGTFQEIVPSIEHEYPYSAKALVTYWNAWPYSVPGGKSTWERTVSNEVKLPLFVAISPVMGEVAAWADYILPDTTYLEKWAWPGSTPTILTKFTSFQQPVVGKLDGSAIGGTGAWAFDPAAANLYEPYLPDTRQIGDIVIGLAKAIGTDAAAAFPGVGTDAFGSGLNLDKAWDYFKHTLNNVAINSGKTAADIVARGGVFADPGTSYDGTNAALLNSKYAGVLHFYSPKLATTVDSITGKKYTGYANWQAASHSDGSAVNDPAYPMHLVTYKSVLHGQARTNVNPWLMTMQPENFVDLSSSDARTMGIETGDLVKIVSASNPVGVVGKARVLEGLRPGVVAVMHHFGHWENGSRSFDVGGTASGYDPSRGSGLTANPVMRLDNVTGNVSLQDPIGGSVAFNDTKVRVERVA